MRQAKSAYPSLSDAVLESRQFRQAFLSHTRKSFAALSCGTETNYAGPFYSRHVHAIATRTFPYFAIHQESVCWKVHLNILCEVIDIQVS